MARKELLVPDLVWTGDRFDAGVAVRLGEDGRIDAVEPAPADAADEGRPGRESASASDTAPAADATPVVRLRRRALLPGFVNAHSHSFQRLIRGTTQWRPARGGRTREDFWTWRVAMFEAALGLSADEIYHTARFCFLEMMRSGITTVGEFHYLHHRPDGSPYPDPNEAAQRVIRAAVDLGMRIVLLNACYVTGGIRQRLGKRQRRFRATSVAEFLGRTEDLAHALGSEPLAAVGLAPHSIRAVPRAWLRPLAEWARSADRPLHMHVSERPAEVESCVREFGLRPVELLGREGLLDEGFTAVHATHVSDSEVGLLGDATVNVCACPTTERDLGDGLLRARDLLEAGASICLGTDSHTSIDFLDEMRLIEYHERLRGLERVVITDPVGERREVAPALIRMATAAGARSLRLEAGRIRAGAPADLIAIDLDHPSVVGWSPETLPAMLTLSATPDIVRDAWVAGARRLEDGCHPLAEETVAAFRAVAAKHRTASSS